MNNTVNDAVFVPQYIYFTYTLKNNYRILFVDKSEQAKVMIMSLTDGAELLNWLESGKEGTLAVRDKEFEVVIVAKKTIPLFWTVAKDELTQWRMKLAKPRSGYSSTQQRLTP